jgi:hypothetical protein
MDAPENPRSTRDRDLRLTRRLSAGVVSAGVLGSLGVAGVVGYTAANAHHSAASGSAPATSQGQNPTYVLQGDDGGEGDDGGGWQLQQAPPQLQQGLGSAPHAQSSGS